jgi:hypothetical protein
MLRESLDMCVLINFPSHNEQHLLSSCIVGDMFRHKFPSPENYLTQAHILQKDTQGGADKSLALERKQQATGLKKMYLLNIFPPELHTLTTSLF